MSLIRETLKAELRADILRSQRKIFHDECQELCGERWSRKEEDQYRRGGREKGSVYVEGHLHFDATQDGKMLELDPVPIDNAFFDKYYDSNLPSLHAGDLLFFAIAIKEGYSLITEDDEFYKKSKATGLTVFRIVEYLEIVKRTGL